MKILSKLCILTLICLSCPIVFAQKKAKAETTANINTGAIPKIIYDENLYKSIQWRNIGPYRGGRSCAVTGVVGKPNLFYFGATGGGVWKTEDAGRTWKNISDGFFGGSIGAVSVSEADNNVIYVGGGEQTIRGNVSYGYGVWKSLDAGKTWVSMGLKDTRHVSRIRIHPKNPDLVYVAAMGNAFAPNPERGVFRSKDGGKNWEKILYVNNDAGAVDLCFDPNNPRTLYASMWRFRRQPHNFSSGGVGSGLWKSVDGGDTWKELSKNEGLPKDTLGIIGVAVSPQNSERVYAMIEAKEGGLFRSENGGKTWKKVNEDRRLRQRAWYHTRIYADTKDDNTIYGLNVSYGKSIDGGNTFTFSEAAHGDHHDLWIAPEDPKRLIMADDGGASISLDGGESWSTYHNQPTSQFYRLTTDNHFPYRIYAAQQDNSTIRIKHRSAGKNISQADWEETAGGESAHIAVDPLNPDIVYGGSYDGYLTRLDHKTGQERAIEVYPNNPMGSGAEGAKLRFQWNFPLFFSPNNPKRLYACSNFLHVTENEGHSWQTISPDLTRNDKSKMGASGGPITKDNTSVEYYGTIFAAAESSRAKDLLWVGSDDGLIHISKDGGKNWKNVTPNKNIMPEWTMINCIEPDPLDAASCFIAATSYKSGDFKPYLFKTKDYGATWTKITEGIDNKHFTRVIRTDPMRKGLLYAGTETGMYISFDDGENWQSFQLNLPIVPITDLTLKNNNLIVATQGRGIWIIDDLLPLHQLNENLIKNDFFIYKPLPAYRTKGTNAKNPSLTEAENHPNGVMLHYFIKDLSDTTTVKVSITEKDGKLIHTFSNKAKEEKDKLTAQKGANLFVWNMIYPEGKKFDGMIFWAAGVAGIKAIPGSYKAQISVSGKIQETDFQIVKDPRLEHIDEKGYKDMFEFQQGVLAKVSETNENIIAMREIRKQLKDYTERIKENKDFKHIVAKANNIDSSMTVIEETLYQTKAKAGQDLLNYPIRLNNKLAYLNSLTNEGDFPPTIQMQAVRQEVTALIDEQLGKFKIIKEKDIPELNRMIRAQNIDAIILK